MTRLLESKLKGLDKIFQPQNELRLLIFIVFIAFALRVGRALLTPVVNVDAVIYLYQAKAIYFGLLSQINHCTIKHITAGPLTAAGFYWLTHDWVFSLRASSILFGTLTVLPIFKLSRLFFPLPVSFLVTLLYATMHIFVSASVDIIRDPAYWFFSAWGFYFFAIGIKFNRAKYLAISSLAFILGAWNRIDAAVFIVFSSFYLTLSIRDDKGKKFLSFLTPVLSAIIVLILIQALRGRGLYLFRLEAFENYLEGAFAVYGEVRRQLQTLIYRPPLGLPVPLFEGIRGLLWWLALGIVFLSAAEAFFYPYFFLFAIGFFSFRKWRSRDLSGYFGVLVILGFSILYLFALYGWSVENRYIVMIMLPGSLFLGYGLEICLSWLQKKSGLKEAILVVIIAALVVFLAVPKELHWHEKDKKIYREIGEFIALRETGTHSVRILAYGDTRRLVSFYAYLSAPEVICPDIEPTLEEIACGEYEKFLNNLKAWNYRYVIWEEKNWPPKGFDLPRHYRPRDFSILGTWEHRDKGKLILFEFLATAPSP